MPKEQSTSDLLKEFLKSQEPDKVDLAVFMRDFDKSRNLELLKTLKPTLHWGPRQIITQAGTEFPNTPYSLSTCVAALALIKAGHAEYTFVDEFFSRIIRQPSSQAAIIAVLSDSEVTAKEFARYLLHFHGLDMNFSWLNNNDGDFPFGCGSDCRFHRLIPPETLGTLSPFEQFVWDLSDDELVEALGWHQGAPLRYGHKSWFVGKLQGSLAKFKPQVLRRHLDKMSQDEASMEMISWNHINLANSDFDEDTLAYGDTSKSPCRHLPVIFLASLRPDQHLEAARLASTSSNAITSSDSLAFLSDHFPDDLRRALSLFIEKEKKQPSDYPTFLIEKVFSTLANSWDDQVKKLFELSLQIPIRSSYYSNEGKLECFHARLLAGMLQAKQSVPDIEANTWFKSLLALIESTVSKPDQRRDLANNLWFTIARENSRPFTAELWELLTDKSKRRRTFAIDGLLMAVSDDTRVEAAKLLNGKKIDARLGAVELLTRLGPHSIPNLQDALATEKSQKVQTAIEEALAKLGVESPAAEEASTEDLLSQIESDKRIKLPTAPWFDLSQFPLIQKNGTPLSEKAVTFLIQKQSKHKTIEAAPGILTLLELLDREKNANSALALLNQWLDSDQLAKDRWALVLAGLLGDKRIIPALTPRIQPWCENSRHKLAEYAAQAISLLATGEALMILDTLANRYRSRFKNIGKACTAAFLAAAEARGVSADELGDLVVPDLGFNSECQKEFDGGKIIAVLQPDFKITWLNPETEKETKSPPSNLSPEGKEELKTLRKILREAIKGQTARLEQMLVRQRRWPVARWQELFEEHPLLQSYAASLVWGIYDSKNELLRTFRRYPNGILAHGSGEMEDLEERDTQIGLVHPLELTEDTLAVWRDHLGRFKVKPPFPQLDRPVEVLEKNHGNRREITFTENVQISGGTFLSRMNKRGWNRGSVIDGGGVTCYYKPFQGAGVEAILFLEEYWVGFDPIDSFPLGKALFAKISTIDRGSYTYDDPQPNDPRVLPFGEVSSIVYSETIADLKALIEGQSKP